MWGVRVFLSVVATTGVLLAQEHGDQPSAAGAPVTNASAGTPAPGDASRGRSIFESKGACFTCHRVADKGSRLGIDLSDIATLRARDALEKSLVAPSLEVQPQNRYYRVVTSDGTVVTGKLYNQDIFSVQMMDSSERLVSFQTSKLKERGFVPTPPMPSFAGKLSKDELTDLVAYLASLKGVVRQ